jgi:RHS repeat-associated protein
MGTNGLVVARYNYDPYGNLLAMSGPLSEANLYRFSSKEWHEKSGLVYYLYRYYEPSLQRWINRDPVSERGGINLYAYVANNPVDLVDPFGFVESSPVLRFFVPGQISWDNSITAFQNRDYLISGAWFSLMVGEQALYVASFGQCRINPGNFVRRETVPTAKAAALEEALRRRDAAGTALSAAMDTFKNAKQGLETAGKQVGKMEQMLGGRDTESYRSAVAAWRAAQAEYLSAKAAHDAAFKNWQAANRAASECR